MSQLFKPQYLSLGLFALVFGLELTTSPNHIFSYLYVGVTIVLSTKLNENQIKSLTLALGILTIFHGIEWQRMTIEPVTLINRSIVVIALAISAWLSIENRHYLETIALQKLELDTQQQLSNLREHHFWEQLKPSILVRKEPLDF
jgi:two-component system NarL family sensor kinase